MKAIDRSGQRYGRLLAMSSFNRRMPNGRSQIFWICHCDCGSEVAVRGECLTSGDTRSCGCLHNDLASARSRTHGASSTRLHRIWSGMLTRCTNTENEGYRNYGGRGIAVCPEWRASFVQFSADMGEPPSALHSLDRRDNERGYEPDNCRWATAREQARNRRGLVEVEFDGKTVCLTEAAEKAGLAYGTVYHRIFKHGWSVADALSAPARTGQKFQFHRRPTP